MDVEINTKAIKNNTINIIYFEFTIETVWYSSQPHCATSYIALYLPKKYKRIKVVLISVDYRLPTIES